MNTMHPLCLAENMITGNGYRISVLTDRLIRLEYQPESLFNDEATQIVLNRDFPVVSYTCEKTDGRLVIETDFLRLSYDEQPFSDAGLMIEIKRSGRVWHFTKDRENFANLGGTARTLDDTDGLIRPEPGLFSYLGWSKLDDSASALITADGIRERDTEEIDIYFFGYENDYLGCLRDFYHLCGHTPMIPRFALGNWWSRYYKYTEESYMALVEAFERENVPLSVAVIDMDWHLVQIDPKYGHGWTGFTWNPEFFPDYRRFLRRLHEHHLAVTLNLHPAHGIRAHEAMYPAVARRLGIDPATEEPARFDLADPAFRDAYFEEVLHPYEEDGVDFWWIDWQQGTRAGSSNIDPLWLLNHFHYHDQERQNRRPMIFSRYAGPGSHRYPVGFSGDTHATWESLEIQPWFTSTASNIGYGWWSHDIGGHMHGSKNEERLVRWVQYGVFSPIMRLHSTNNDFFAKEPWKLDEPYRRIVDEMLRLRHRLIPYLYTMCYLAWKEDLPLIRPVYYHHADDRAAYEVRNEYYFGTELLVGAITEPMDPELRMASVSVLIPEGRWYDILTGQAYEGRSRRKLYRRLDSIPVLLKAGGILPLAAASGDLSATEVPKSMDLYVGAGASGSFTLYEDDGVSNDYLEGAGAFTLIEAVYSESEGETVITIHPVKGDSRWTPVSRTWNVHLLGAGHNGEASVQTISVDAAEGGRIVFRHGRLAQTDKKQALFDLLDYVWTSMDTKLRIYQLYREAADDREFLRALDDIEAPEQLKDAITELFEDGTDSKE
ncbi:MAG: DUF5110 domain-containing protein [Firmicutes bacterium]|nr:DUF5110 domain-containing protein [Bacillota bacterium]